MNIDKRCRSDFEITLYDTLVLQTLTNLFIILDNPLTCLLWNPPIQFKCFRVCIILHKYTSIYHHFKK